MSTPVERLDATSTQVVLRERPLTAPATLTIGFDGGAPVTVSTDNNGIVATAAARPAGTGTDLLAAAVRGKSVHLPWSVTVAGLPAGLTTADVADVVLMAQYEFVTF
jgi:hypothetical protein